MSYCSVRLIDESNDIRNEVWVGSSPEVGGLFQSNAYIKRSRSENDDATVIHSRDQVRFYIMTQISLCVGWARAAVTLAST